MNRSEREISLPAARVGEVSARRRSLVAACTAHAVHDGLTDAVYVLLPVWQAQFGLSFAQIGLLRGAYSGTMADCQLLAGRVARAGGANVC